MSARFAAVGPIAQSVEQRTFNPWVDGSSPSGPTNGHSSGGFIIRNLLNLRFIDVLQGSSVAVMRRDLHKVFNVRSLISRVVKDALKDSPFGFFRLITQELMFFRGNPFYGQTAEDGILQKLLIQRKGFYVDIGAGRPKSGSNTQVFYRRAGWNGILVDPINRNARLLKLLRPKDLVLESLVGKGKAEIEFWEFEPYEYSTADKNVASKVLQIEGVRLKKHTYLGIKTLAEITKECDVSLPSLLNIDCEGFDLEVLESNNWANFRPTVFCIEEWDFKFELEETEIGSYLRNLNYSRFAFTGLSSVFVDDLDLHGVGSRSLDSNGN